MQRFYFGITQHFSSKLDGQLICEAETVVSNVEHLAESVRNRTDPANDKQIVAPSGIDVEHTQRIVAVRRHDDLSGRKHVLLCFDCERQIEADGAVEFPQVDTYSVQQLVHGLFTRLQDAFAEWVILRDRRSYGGVAHSDGESLQEPS